MSPGKISIEYIAVDCKVLSLQIDLRGIVLIQKPDHIPVHFVTYMYVLYGYTAWEKNVSRETQHNVNITSESCCFFRQNAK